MIIKPFNSFENLSLISDTITPCSRLVTHDEKIYFLSFVKTCQSLTLLNERLLMLWASWRSSRRGELNAPCLGLRRPTATFANLEEFFLLVPLIPVYKYELVTWPSRIWELGEWSKMTDTSISSPTQFVLACAVQHDREVAWWTMAYWHRLSDRLHLSQHSDRGR